jgi:hypothetical protein
MHSFTTGRRNTPRWGIRVEAVEAVGGRERQAQATGSRLEPGQDYASGCAVKKVLKPSRKRVQIDELRVFGGRQAQD